MNINDAIEVRKVFNSYPLINDTEGIIQQELIAIDVNKYHLALNELIKKIMPSENTQEAVNYLSDNDIEYQDALTDFLILVLEKRIRAESAIKAVDFKKDYEGVHA
jgi:hypothetical protein